VFVNLCICTNINHKGTQPGLLRAKVLYTHNVRRACKHKSQWYTHAHASLHTHTHKHTHTHLQSDMNLAAFCDARAVHKLGSTYC